MKKTYMTIGRIKQELMLEGLQQRADRLAFKLWSEKYERELKERENNKIFNQKYAAKRSK